MSPIKLALKNIWRLWDRYAVFALISLIGAFLIAAVLSLLQGTRTLTNMLTLPYPEYCRVEYLDETKRAPYKEVGLGPYAPMLEMFLEKHAVAEEIRVSDYYEKQLPLSCITEKGTVSEAPGAVFPIFVIPDTAWNGSFLRGERVLVAGRHLTYEDRGSHLLLLDEEAAEINGLTVGSNVKMDTPAGEVTYRVAGLFRTLKVQPLAASYMDVPTNAVLASDVADASAKVIGKSYDMYVKFAPGTDVEEFVAYMNEFPNAFSLQEQGFTLVSVKELNAAYNKGANTLFVITAIMLVSLSAIVACADFAFCRVMIASRRREILIMRALNAGRKRIVGQFIAEMAFVFVPCTLIGTAAAARVCRAVIGEMLVRFSNMISPENLRNTSSVYMDHVSTLQTAVTNPLTGQALLSLCALAAGLLGGIVLISTGLQLWRVSDEKLMNLLAEGRQ